MSPFSLPTGRLAQGVAITVLTVMMVWFGTLANQCVKDGPLRIVRLELASTVMSANHFLDTWKSAYPADWQPRLQTAQYWDTWFICAYAPLFTLLCWLAAGHFAGRFPGLGSAGRVLAAGQLVAGALDFLENAAINKAIARGVAETPWPLIGSTASGAKWTLIVAFLVFGLAAVGDWVVGKG